MTATATILRKGDRGPEVVDLQYLLLFRGGATPASLGPADGIFGSKTEAAVKAAQKQFGIEQDGEVSILWGKLAAPREWPTKFTGKFMKKGDTGDSVRELQLGLQSKNFYSGKIDSDFGPLTLAAVIKLQKFGEPFSNVEGIVGPMTFSAAIGD